MAGYVKFYRDILDHCVVHKDNDYLAVWMYLLLNANHEPGQCEFGSKTITLNPGQMVRGRKQISVKAIVNESKVERILKRFESEQMIEQQTSSRKRLITVLNWSTYQKGKQPNEQKNEQQLNNNRTTNEQQMNTNKNDKKYKNEKNNTYKDICQRVIENLNWQTGRKFKTVESNTKHIIARLNEGYSEEECLRVIHNKVIDWLDNPDMKDFLRPSTLFGTKFDGYLQGNDQSGLRTNAEIEKIIKESENTCE